MKIDNEVSKSFVQKFMRPSTADKPGGKVGRIWQVSPGQLIGVPFGQTVPNTAPLLIVAMSKTGAVVDLEKLDKAKRAPTEQTVWAPEDGCIYYRTECALSDVSPIAHPLPWSHFREQAALDSRRRPETACARSETHDRPRDAVADDRPQGQLWPQQRLMPEALCGAAKAAVPEYERLRFRQWHADGEEAGVLNHPLA